MNNRWEWGRGFMLNRNWHLTTYGLFVPTDITCSCCVYYNIFFFFPGVSVTCNKLTPVNAPSCYHVNVCRRSNRVRHWFYGCAGADVLFSIYYTRARNNCAVSRTTSYTSLPPSVRQLRRFARHAGARCRHYCWTATPPACENSREIAVCACVEQYPETNVTNTHTYRQHIWIWVTQSNLID